jgi:hypothetical protein
MPPNGSTNPVSLRPVRDRDTLPPSPRPTRQERDAAFEKSMGLLMLEAGLHEQVAVIERQILEYKRAYNVEMAVVAAYDVESTP